MHICMAWDKKDAYFFNNGVIIGDEGDASFCGDDGEGKFKVGGHFFVEVVVGAEVGPGKQVLQLT